MSEPTITTPFDLRAAIAAAWDAEEARYAASVAAQAVQAQADATREREMAAAGLTKALHAVGIPITAPAPSITLDGLSFTAEWEYHEWHLYLSQPCAGQCGNTAKRGPINYLYQLRDADAEMQASPRWCDACEAAMEAAQRADQRAQAREANAAYRAAQAAITETLEARLLAVLREFIRATREEM